MLNSKFPKIVPTSSYASKQFMLIKNGHTQSPTLLHIQNPNPQPKIENHHFQTPNTNLESESPIPICDQSPISNLISNIVQKIRNFSKEVLHFKEYFASVEQNKHYASFERK